MYTLGFVLLGVGTVVSFGAFIFATKNLLGSGDRSTDKLFFGHIGAMIAMAIGGLASTAGIIILVATFLKQLVD